MSTSPELITNDVFYRQRGVELSIAPERVLSYSKDGRIVRKRFDPVSGYCVYTAFLNHPRSSSFAPGSSLYRRSDLHRFHGICNDARHRHNAYQPATCGWRRLADRIEALVI